MELPSGWIFIPRIKCMAKIEVEQRELITCEKCKHWYKDADSGMSCEYTEMSQPEDGFCNWAERRGEEE